MAYDGHLSFDTKLDANGFIAGIKKLGGIAKSGLSVLGGTVAGVTAAMGAGVAAGLKYNADMQMYMANFETMLGSAAAATEFVDQLKETAAKTPFEMSDLANASKTLLAFGSDASNTNDQIKMLGDISLGNAQKLSTLSTAFGRIQSNGRASMEEINMMIDSGFNPLNLIAEKTGESMDELRKRVSAGGVSFQEINDAMIQATSAGGQFYGGMEKASQTMDGLISTLKDNAMALLGEVAQPLTEQLTSTLLPAAIDAIDQLSAAFQENGAEGLIQTGAQLAVDLATGLAEHLPGIIELAISFIDTFVAALSENMPQLLAAGGQLIISIGEGMLQLLPSLGSLGISIVSGIASAITSNSGEIQGGAQSLLDNLVSFLETGLPKMLSAGVGFVQNIAEGLLQNLPAVISAAGNILNQLLDAFLAGLPKMLESGVKLIGNLASGLRDNIPAIVSAIGTAIGQLIVTIASHLPEILEKGLEIVGKLAAGVIEAIPDIITAAGDLISSIWEEISKTDWLELGGNIISGIVNGLKDGLGRIAKAAKEVASEALEAAKNFLGIHSPSRVFRDEVGKNIALGIGDGIRRNKEYAEKSAEEVAQAILSAAKKKLENHKVYNAMTLADEVAFWNEVRKQTDEGTQARIDADKEYFSAKQNLNQKMQDAEADYAEKVAKTYEELNDKIHDLNQEYRDALDDRTESIKNAYGLFDAFDSETDLTSGDMLENLRSQVDGLTEWKNNLRDLEKRGIDDELLSELQDLGPKSAAEIKLLTEMTDAELDEYVSLFRQKNRIAKSQAVAELEPMRDDIADQIAELKRETQKELAAYQQEYISAMTELGVVLNKPAEDLKLMMAQNAVEMVATLAETMKTESESSDNQTKFKALADGILQSTDSLSGDLLTVGRTAIDSMIQGLKERSGALSQAMRSVVSGAVNQALDAVGVSEKINAAITDIENSVSIPERPAQAYGNEGYGPGVPIDYARIGREMAAAMDGVGVSMDGKSVGKIVSEPVNDELGDYSRREERDI